MWGESSKNCESNCQCSGLITENFRINSGNSAAKRRRDEAISTNFKHKMHPHSLDFNKKSPLASPIATPNKRRVLGELQNNIFLQKINQNSPKTKMSSPLRKSPFSDIESQLIKSPFLDTTLPPLKSTFLDLSSPVTSRVIKSKSSSRISRIVEERIRFKRDNKENESPMLSESFMKFDIEDETRDSAFSESFHETKSMTSWSVTKLDFTESLQTKAFDFEKQEKTDFVPEKETEMYSEDQDFDTLHDLEEEFEADNFDTCTKYEIISTDSPNIISRGRPSTSRKVNSRNFNFGAPLAENEPSTSFNKPSSTTTRTLNFEDSFDFTSPVIKRSFSGSVKKSLKFNETPTKVLKPERSDSGMSLTSPCSTKLRIFPSESTTSMESGFISELEEPFLEIEESSNSPKISNLNQLLSGKINDKAVERPILKRPGWQRSYSVDTTNLSAPKAKMSLFSVLKGEKRSQKRPEPFEAGNNLKKRKKSNFLAVPEIPKRFGRPILQRAVSENNASIMSAMARSDEDPDLIGDFSRPFSLPLAAGLHSDLKAISGATLAGLLRGEFSVGGYQVIDCRYPYEFAGGHITGAVNLYTPQQILSLVNKPLSAQDKGGKILVLHCEFSRHRGPSLYRFLRSSDRATNRERYPHLHYPEVYLLHDGYKAFYDKYPSLCTPCGYTTMNDPQYHHLLQGYTQHL